MQFIGTGDGRDGTIPNSGVINTYAAMSVTAGNPVVTTALVVSVGDMVLLHQTQGTGHGTWELVFVKTVGSGQFTADRNPVASYTGKAQAVKIPQYIGGSPSGVLTATAWNGTIGGIIAWASRGLVTGVNGGSVNLTGLGFRGGTGGNDNTGTGGEGYTSTHPDNQKTHDNGGRAEGASSGRGGGNRTAGLKDGTGAAQVDAGLTAGSADGTLIDLGGGSGGSSVNSNPRDGVIGGGIGFIFGSLSALPLISDGIRGIDSTGDRASGGSAGGFFFCKGPQLLMGSSISTSEGKVGGTGLGGASNANSGGRGGDGGYRLEGCTITGTTVPAASTTTGLDFCSAGSGQVY